METIDFKKTLDVYKAKHNQFRILDVPRLQYLMIDGHGDPNTSKAFSGAVEKLYPVAYGLKFASKKQLEKDYVVPPLEGLWHADNMETFTTHRNKSAWDWTLLLMVPDWISGEMFEATKAAASKKTGLNLDLLRLESIEEGTCVQLLHIGSYDDEGPILHKLHHEFIPQQGYRMVKLHHEIYLSDFRKVVPEKLRTIIRQPLEKNDQW